VLVLVQADLLRDLDSRDVRQVQKAVGQGAGRVRGIDGDHRRSSGTGATGNRHRGNRGWGRCPMLDFQRVNSVFRATTSGVVRKESRLKVMPNTWMDIDG